jgi:MFS family permease
MRATPFLIRTGTLPAAALARRFGLGKVLLACFACVSGISAVCALQTTPVPLLALSFLGGVAFSMYAVSLAPAIALLTSERARPTGFSISTAGSIALGVPVNWLAGLLPGWLGGKRPALLVGCALVALAMWPAARLKIAPAPVDGTKLYPRSRFVAAFLIVFGIWNLATGSFNPFANTYFASHLRTPVQRVGRIFSGAQAAQVAALLLAPLVLRKWGTVSGTAAMLMATALALGALAAGPGAMAAPAVFAAYTAVQWMSDPGINTLLMDRVREQERSGAAALMMLVSFAAQFASAFAGGGAIARFGYPIVLACAAGLAAIAALAFRSLPGPAAGPVLRPAEQAVLVRASAPDTAAD